MKYTLNTITRHPKLLLTVLFVFPFVTSSYGQNDIGKTFNQLYTTGAIPGYIRFQRLNQYEKEIDSFYNSLDNSRDSLVSKNNTEKTTQIFQKNDFIKNRGRIFLTSYENGKPVKMEKAFSKGMPAPCQCLIKNDSILVNISIGFFGGLGYILNITENNFLARHYLYVSGANPYKENVADSFTNQLLVRSKFQHLILDKKPTFTTGQQLTGYLTTTTEKYYVNKFGNELDTVYTIGKVYFTCITRIY
jgi:hypothetical protein